MFGIFFGITRQLPRIECANIQPVILYSVNYTIWALTAYVPPVYIPLAAVEALFQSTALVSSLLVFELLLKSETKWVEVSIKIMCKSLLK